MFFDTCVSIVQYRIHFNRQLIKTIFLLCSVVDLGPHILRLHTSLFFFYVHNIIMYLCAVIEVTQKHRACFFPPFYIHANTVSSSMVVVISSNNVPNTAAAASLKHLHRERDFVIMLHVNCSLCGR